MFLVAADGFYSSVGKVCNRPNSLTDFFAESVELRQTVWLVYNSHPTVMWQSESARNELGEIGQIVENTTFPLNVTITAYLIE